MGRVFEGVILTLCFGLRKMLCVEILWMLGSLTILHLQGCATSLYLTLRDISPGNPIPGYKFSGVVVRN